MSVSFSATRRTIDAVNAVCFFRVMLLRIKGIVFAFNVEFRDNLKFMRAINTNEQRLITNFSTTEFAVFMLNEVHYLDQVCKIMT